MPLSGYVCEDVPKESGTTELAISSFVSPVPFLQRVREIFLYLRSTPYVMKNKNQINGLSALSD